MSKAQQGSFTVALASSSMVDVLVIVGLPYLSVEMTLMKLGVARHSASALKLGSARGIVEQDTECSSSGGLLGPKCRHQSLYLNESERMIMSKEQENKELVGRWFTGFLGQDLQPRKEITRFY
jgi:hypothetical protein